MKPKPSVTPSICGIERRKPKFDSRRRDHDDVGTRCQAHGRGKQHQWSEQLAHEASLHDTPGHAQRPACQACAVGRSAPQECPQLPQRYSRHVRHRRCRGHDVEEQCEFLRCARIARLGAARRQKAARVQTRAARATKLSTTRLRPALSKSMVSLLPSTSATSRSRTSGGTRARPARSREPLVGGGDELAFERHRRRASCGGPRGSTAPWRAASRASCSRSGSRRRARRSGCGRRG